MFKDITWRCHICGKERPDNKISVHTTSKKIPGTNGATVQQNVRYCNDDPDCIEKSKTFSFYNTEDDE